MINTKPSELEYLSLSQIILSHMVDGFEGSGLNEAQRIVADRVVEGEKHLRELFPIFSRRYLNSKQPDVASFKNNLDYLRFIYKKRTHLVDDVVPYLDTVRRGLIRKYDTLNPSSRSYNSGYCNELMGMPNRIEVAYSSSVRTARMVLFRRKNMERAIRKIAYRRLLYEIEKKKTPKGNKPPIAKRVDIDDFFGIKAVTSREEQARGRLFENIYLNLHKFDLRADSRQEVVETEDGEILLPPGVDDHYVDIKKKRSNIIQLKVHPLHNPNFRLREIDLTDMVNFLVGEMDHVRFSANRENKAKKLLRERRSYQRRFNQLIRRGNQVVELVPKEVDRMRVLFPSLPF
jgi:hypothetical protein